MPSGKVWKEKAAEFGINKGNARNCFNLFNIGQNWMH